MFWIVFYYYHQSKFPSSARTLHTWGLIFHNKIIISPSFSFFSWFWTSFYQTRKIKKGLFFFKWALFFLLESWETEHSFFFFLAQKGDAWVENTPNEGNLDSIWDLVQIFLFLFCLGLKKLLWILIHFSLHFKSLKLGVWNKPTYTWVWRSKFWSFK